MDDGEVFVGYDEGPVIFRSTYIQSLSCVMLTLIIGQPTNSSSEESSRARCLTISSDNGTDDYDTSEKARIPAWTGDLPSRSRKCLIDVSTTDRILFKGSAVCRSPILGQWCLTPR